MTVIDTHAHIYSARYMDFLELHGVDPASTAIARNMNASDEVGEIAERLRQMDAAGVDYQVLSTTPQSPYLPDADAAVEAARMVNDIYAQVIADHPDRFVAYGAVPFLQPEAAVTEAQRALDELGFVGIALNAMIAPDRSVTDEEFLPLFEELNRRGAIVYFHPTGNAAFSQPMLSKHLEWVNGAIVEDAVVLLQLMKADYIRRFPNIRFHIAHLGGDVPFILQRLEDNYTDWNSMAHSPMEQVKEVWFDAANFYPPSLKFAHDHAYDPDKLLAGSDYPYFQEHYYTRAFEYIREAGLGAADEHKVLEENARALYGDIFSR